MVRSMRGLGVLLPAAAVLALLVGCSGSNNKNANANSAAPATTVAATTSAPVTPVAAARAASPTAAAPAAAATGTARPAASATPARAGSPAAATARPAGSPAAGAVAADPALQKALEGAALTEADLPTGFSKQNEDRTTDASLGEVADYMVTYAYLGQGSGGPEGQALIDGLAAFKDTTTATDSFKNLQADIANQAGSDLKLTPFDGGPKLGDETVTLQVSGTQDGIAVGGYAIVWRRGRYAAAVIQVAVPEPKSIDDAAGLAAKQDAKLKALP